MALSPLQARLQMQQDYGAVKQGGVISQAASGIRGERSPRHVGGGGEHDTKEKGNGSSSNAIADSDNANGGTDASDNNGNTNLDPTHERSVFESIIQRVQWSKQECNAVPPDQKNTLTKTIVAATDLPMLPEGGVEATLQKWLEDNPLSKTKDDNNNNGSSNNNNEDKSSPASSSYPTCYLPPTKSCHVSTYTLIIMSHTTARLHDFMTPLATMVQSWPGLTEIIVVWNSPRDTLTKVAHDNQSNTKKKHKEIKEQEYASQLLAWDSNTTHPLRIFFSLEHNLTNNLLNRYHPLLQPKNEAIMYFDDDGPFWSKEAMIDGGLELWKRNSNVQVGGFPRNVRFLSKRMLELEKDRLQRSMDVVVADRIDGVTNDGVGGEVSYPQFTPTCRDVTGDTVEYNYFVFPDFDAHVLLPSGTFLHRNFLCFIWHPAFSELRNYVVSHKTYPDDITVSTLVSHLVGRAPRTFPREVKAGDNEEKKRRRLLEEDGEFLNSERENDMENYKLHHSNTNDLEMQSPQPNQSHRRLLWKQKNWAAMREEAINSLVGYFGSIHPGTIGWCAGTSHIKKNNRGNIPHHCNPEKPTLDLIPWLIEGGVGYDQCPH